MAISRHSKSILPFTNCGLNLLWKALKTNNSSDKIKILKNFQRRFRPELISSVIDKECDAILKSLI